MLELVKIQELAPGDVIRPFESMSFPDAVVKKNDTTNRILHLARPYARAHLTFSTSPTFLLGVEEWQLPYVEDAVIAFVSSGHTD